MSSTAAALPLEVAGDRRGWHAFWAFLAVVALLLVGHGGFVLEVAYTPMAVVLGYYLLSKFPRVYLFHTIFAVCMSGFVRRAAEGGNVRDQSLILAATLAVPMLAGLSFLKFDYTSSKNIAFTLALMGIAYGACVGILYGGVRIVIVSLIGWVSPVMFGMWCVREQKRDPSLAASFLRSSLILGTISAAYGVMQYVHPAQWDVDWLTQMQANGQAHSMGSPEAYGIRVFSTLNNSQGAGALFGLCLLQSTMLKSKWRWACVPVCLAGLIVTSVRSAWLACLLIGVLLFVRSGPVARLKTLAAVVCVGGLIALSSGTAEGAKFLGRFGTLGDMKRETSYQERKKGREDALDLAWKGMPFGYGFGYAGVQARTVRFTPVDVGWTTIPIELGPLGIALYGSGLLIMLFGVIWKSYTGDDLMASLGVSALFILALLFDTNTLAASLGIFFWAPAAFLLQIPLPPGRRSAHHHT